MASLSQKFSRFHGPNFSRFHGQSRLVSFEQRGNFCAHRAGRDHLKQPMLLRHLPVGSNGLTMEYVGQIPIELLLRIIGSVYFGFVSLFLADPPVLNFQQPIGVEHGRVYQVYYIIYHVLFDDVIDQGLAVQRRGAVYFDQPTFQVGVNQNVVAE